jgi:hypothetical protein
MTEYRLGPRFFGLSHFSSSASLCVAAVKLFFNCMVRTGPGYLFTGERQMGRMGRMGRGGGGNKARVRDPQQGLACGDLPALVGGRACCGPMGERLKVKV